MGTERARNSPLRLKVEKLLKPVVDRLTKIPGIKADHITLAGLGLVGLGSLEKVLMPDSLPAALIAFGLMSFGVSGDALDGALARALDQSSPHGALLDLLVDRGEESMMALARIFAASSRRDPLGVLAAFLAGLTNPIPSYLRAKVEAKGGVVPESGKNPISFLGTRGGRVLTSVPTTAFPTTVEFNGLSFQAGIDFASALANIITTCERFSILKKVKDQGGEGSDLNLVGKEKEEKLRRFILFNTVGILLAGVIGLVNSLAKYR